MYDGVKTFFNEKEVEINLAEIKLRLPSDFQIFRKRQRGISQTV